MEAWEQAFIHFTAFLRDGKQYSPFETYDSGRYPYIPLDPHKFSQICSFIIKVTKAYMKKRDDHSFTPPLRFLEIGTGPGANILMLSILALRISRFLECSGLEIDPKSVAMAQQLLRYGGPRIFNCDAMNFGDYDKYDFIYYYCPFSDPEKEIDLECLIETKCKIGCYLICCLKKSDTIRSDPRFRLIYQEAPYLSSTTIYRKIKE